MHAAGMHREGGNEGQSPGGSRLVRAVEARLGYPSMSSYIRRQREEWNDSGSEISSVASSTPSHVSQPGPATSISAAMERVVRLERKRAGKAYRRTLSSLWSNIHYILRLGPALHAWRSSTATTLRQLQREKHDTEIKAREARLLALEDKVKMQEKMCCSHDDLAAKVVLLQELQKRTEADHSRERASNREKVDELQHECNVLRAQVNDKNGLEQEHIAMVEKMHWKVQEELRNEIHVTNVSMAALEEKYKAQDDEMRALDATRAALEEKCKAQDDEMRALDATRAALEKQLAEQRNKLVFIEKERDAQLEVLMSAQSSLQHDLRQAQEEIVRLEKEAKTRSDRIETERGMQLDTKLEAAQGSLYQLEEANKALVLKTDELHRAQEEIARLMVEVCASEEKRDAQYENTKQQQEQISEMVQRMLAAGMEELQEAADSDERLSAVHLKQMEELVLLRGMSRRKDEEKFRLELEISSLNDIISQLNAQLRNKEDEINTLSQETEEAISHHILLTRQAQDQADAARSQRSEMEHMLMNAKEEHTEQMKVLLAQREDRGADLVNKTLEIERLQRCIQDMTNQMESSVNVLDESRMDLALKIDDYQLASEELAAKDKTIYDAEIRVQQLCSNLQKVEGKLQRKEMEELQLREELLAIEKERERERQTMEDAMTENKNDADSAILESKRQQEELSRLKALVRRANDEKVKLTDDFERQIAELQASLGNIHRELRLREEEINEVQDEKGKLTRDFERQIAELQASLSTANHELRMREEEINEIAEHVRDHQGQQDEQRHELLPVVLELKAQHSEEVASIHQMNAESMEEIKRLHNVLESLKKDHDVALSEMRARVGYEVENKTLSLQLRLAEAHSSLEAAYIQIMESERTLGEAIQNLDVVVTQAKKEADLRAIEIGSKWERMRSQSVHKENRAREIEEQLREDFEAANFALETVTDELRETKVALEAEVATNKGHFEAFFALQGDSRDKDTIIQMYISFTEQMREQIDTVKEDLQTSEEVRLKTQEDNVILRGSLRRKEDERHKFESENERLLKIISEKDHEIDTKSEQMEAASLQHSSDIAKFQFELSALQLKASSTQELMSGEKDKMEKEFEVERRALLQEAEQRNGELILKSKEISNLHLEIEKLKEGKQKEILLHQELKNQEFERAQSSVRAEIERIRESKDTELQNLVASQSQELARLSESKNKEIQSIEAFKNREVQCLHEMKSKEIRNITESKDKEIQSLTEWTDKLIKGLREEVQILTESKNSEVKSLTESRDKEIKGFKQEIQRLTDSKETEIQSLTESKDKEIKRLKQEIQRLTELKDKEIQSVTGSKDKEIKELVQTLTASKDKEVQSVTESKDKEIKELRQEIGSLVEARDREIQRIMNAKDEEIQSIIESTDKDIKDLRQEVQCLIVAKEKEIQSVTDQDTKKINGLKEQIMQLAKQCDENARLADLREHELIDFKGKHVAVLEVQSDNQRESLQEVERLKRESEDLRKTEIGLQNQLKDSLGQLRSKNEAISRLERQLGTMQEQVATLQKEREESMSELEGLYGLRDEVVLLREEIRCKDEGQKHTEDELEGLKTGTDAALEDLQTALSKAKKEVREKNMKIEDLLLKVEKLHLDSEEKKKSMKELQSMMRGKAILEKQEMHNTSVKQRKVEDENQHLLRQLQHERNCRVQLQLSWACLEKTMEVICPPLAHARLHLVFTAKTSLFKDDSGYDDHKTPVDKWLRSSFAKALNVDICALGVSHISWGSVWVGSVRSIDDQVPPWAPQVPEGHSLAIALVRFNSVKGAVESASQLAERFCMLMKKRGSPLYQCLAETCTTVLGCLPPQEPVPGEEGMLPSQVAERMVTVEDMGFTLFSDCSGQYVVTYILEGSVASDYESFEPGATVHEIDGVSIAKRPVAEVNQLLKGSPGSTLAMLVIKGGEPTNASSMQANLVIMARPNVAQSATPLQKARESMLHPDVSDLISMGDLSVVVQPSYVGAPKHMDLSDSLILDANGHYDLEGHSTPFAEKHAAIGPAEASGGDGGDIEGSLGDTQSANGLLIQLKTKKEKLRQHLSDQEAGLKLMLEARAENKRGVSEPGSENENIDLLAREAEPCKWDTLDL